MGFATATYTCCGCLVTDTMWQPWHGVHTLHTTSPAHTHTTVLADTAVQLVWGCLSTQSGVVSQHNSKAHPTPSASHQCTASNVEASNPMDTLRAHPTSLRCNRGPAYTPTCVHTTTNSPVSLWQLQARATVRHVCSQSRSLVKAQHRAAEARKRLRSMDGIRHDRL